MRAFLGTGNSPGTTMVVDAHGAGPLTYAIMDADVIVVGAGVGGLSAAGLLAKSGLRVLVIDRNYMPGGACGAIRRDGITFDLGAAMLFGFGGSELERPLAVAMVGGLITSTLFTLLALPSFYAWVGNGKEVKDPGCA